MHLARQSLFALLSISSIVAATAASAADMPQSSACSVMGIVSGGGSIDGQSYELNGVETKYEWYSGFGDGALGLTCGNWNFQVDAALNHFAGTDTPTPDTGHFYQNQSHIGGAIFARVPDRGAMGISASYIKDSADLDIESPGGNTSLSATGNTNRFGAFGEYYINEQFTLGASANYLTGEVPSVFSPINVDISGFEIGGRAKYYASENLAFSGSVDIFRGKYVFGVIDAEFNGLAASLEGEYAVPNTSASILAGGRLASRELSDPSLSPATLKDTQLYVGIKFDLGGASSSLAERDRTGTYDNTSMFAEKLPSIGQSVVRGENQ